jgi:hypothetical protein
MCKYAEEFLIPWVGLGIGDAYGRPARERLGRICLRAPSTASNSRGRLWELFQFQSVPQVHARTPGRPTTHKQCQLCTKIIVRVAASTQNIYNR